MEENSTKKSRVIACGIVFALIFILTATLIIIGIREPIVLGQELIYAVPSDERETYIQEKYEFTNPVIAKDMTYFFVTNTSEEQKTINIENLTVERLVSGEWVSVKEETGDASYTLEPNETGKVEIKFTDFYEGEYRIIVDGKYEVNFAVKEAVDSGIAK